MKLKSIEIERFRAVRFCRLELHPEVTVLVGDNASGKTLILDAIRLLLRPVVGELRGCSGRMMDFSRISAKLTPLLGQVVGERSLGRLPG